MLAGGAQQTLVMRDMPGIFIRCTPGKPDERQRGEHRGGEVEPMEANVAWGYAGTDPRRRGGL